MTRDLYSLAELRARDSRRLMSAGGKGRGRVIVITVIVRKRRNTGERRSSHFCPQQSFDHTLQAMVHIPCRVHSTPVSVKSFIAKTSRRLEVDKSPHELRTAGGPEVADASDSLRNFSLKNLSRVQ